jgi:hypothetical protein
MTSTLDALGAAPQVAPGYRAKDIVMAATVDPVRRLVLITGAIDSNKHDILVRVELPSAGRWRVVKAETNLTDRAWLAWQISLGEGTTVAEDATNLCRQYSKVHVAEDRSRVTFYDGEIRPGEAILKIFELQTKLPRIVMAHNRMDEEEDVEDGEQATPTAPDEVEARVVAGFAAKPYIEAFLPVELVGAHDA